MQSSRPNVLMTITEIPLAPSHICVPQRPVSVDPSQPLFATDALHMAHAYWCAGQASPARVLCRRVLAVRPRQPEALHLLGLIAHAQGYLDEAIDHLASACVHPLAPAAFHCNLAALLNIRGNYVQAIAAGRRAIELDPYLSDAFLQLAQAHSARLDADGALHWLKRLHGFAPEHVQSHIARASVLLKAQRLDEALVSVQRAQQLAPDDSQALLVLAQVLEAQRHIASALACLDQLILRRDTVRQQALTARAVLLLRRGQGLSAFDHAVQVSAEDPRVLAARARYKTFQAGDSDIAALEGALLDPRTLALDDQLAIRFALGGAYLDLHDSANAFLHLDIANRLKRETYDYDPAQAHQLMRRIAQVFDHAHFEQRDGLGAASELPVFIIGMPRSGTTLVERVLSAHPQVQGSHDLPSLRVAVDSIGQFPDATAGWNTDELYWIGRHYLDRVEPLAHGKARLIDTQPNNFLYAGLILQALPGARIIHCRRNALDNCLSCYAQPLSGDNLYSHDQRELGEHHRHYEALMAHWRVILPAERFIEVDYESMVADTEGEARRLLDFVGLGWDAACQAYCQTVQVRSDSVGRGARHAGNLSEVAAGLLG